MTKALEACVVNDDELAHYDTTTNEELSAYLDSLPRDELKDPNRSAEEISVLMKRYNAEVVAPKKKGTQVVTSKPKSIMDLSAHR